MDPQSLFNFFQQLTAGIFGTKISAVILQIAAVLVFVYLVLWSIAKTKDLIVSHFLPLFYKPEERRLAERRRRFAEHVESEIKRLNRLEDWTDYHFTELEAEVEAEGDWRRSTVIPFLTRTYSGLRREKSLSKALGTSKERRILLQGEPGTGKSVALRHIALTMSQIAAKRVDLKKIIPIYVNLKELHRNEGQSVNRKLVHQFILASLNRVNDRDIEEFLVQNFDKGLEDGTWLFLFDFFDEIPEVLGSTNADKTVSEYSQAISDFLHGMNQCKGIVASRHFRGPERSGWPVFTILTLTDVRKKELIRRSELNKSAEQLILNGLATAPTSVASMSNNPLFLGLLCDHVKHENHFPENIHAVFEAYINSRLQRDSDRLTMRFGMTQDEIRAAAEYVAFTMSSDEKLGLSPSRFDLFTAMERNGFSVNDLDSKLNALEYIKLARTESSLNSNEKLFTFAHRRFQEYFSTCVVLREATLVEPRKLLLDGRWRETAVTLFQTQPLTKLSHILSEAEAIFMGLSEEVEFLIEDLIIYIQKEDEEDTNTIRTIPINNDVYHLCSLFQEGFGKRAIELPESLTKKISSILLSVFANGPLLQRQLTLEVAGATQQDILNYILAEGFKSQSSTLNNIAYRQSAYLIKIKPEISLYIKNAIIQLASVSDFRSRYYELRAQISRLESPEIYLYLLNYLRRTSNPFSFFYYLGIGYLGLFLPGGLYYLIRQSSAELFPGFDAIFIIGLIFTWFWWVPPFGNRYYYLNRLVDLDYVPHQFDIFIYRFYPTYIRDLKHQSELKKDEKGASPDMREILLFVPLLWFLVTLISTLFLAGYLSDQSQYTDLRIINQNNLKIIILAFTGIALVIYSGLSLLIVTMSGVDFWMEIQSFQSKLKNRNRIRTLLANGQKLDPQSFINVLSSLHPPLLSRFVDSVRKQDMFEKSQTACDWLTEFSIQVEKAYKEKDKYISSLDNFYPPINFLYWLLPNVLAKYIKSNKECYKFVETVDPLTGLRYKSITSKLLDELNLLLEKIQKDLKATD